MEHAGVKIRFSLILLSLSVCVQTGSISEQEFAMRIEKDLHSQHQPSLLPFLQVYTCMYRYTHRRNHTQLIMYALLWYTYIALGITMDFPTLLSL